MKDKMKSVYEITFYIYYLFGKLLQTYISAVIRDIKLKKTKTISPDWLQVQELS